MNPLPQNNSLWKWTAGLSLFFAICYGLYRGISWQIKSSQVTSFRVQEVVRRDLVQTVMISGSVSPIRSTTIAMPYDGYVRKLFVEIGDKVKLGDPIVIVSQNSQGRMDENYPILAPFSGSVVQVLKSEGEYAEKVSPNGKQHIVRIDDLTKLFLVADVPEIDIGKLKVGQKASIKAAALNGKAFSARVVSLSQASKLSENWDRSRVEFMVRLEILDSDAALLPGMTAMAEVITKEVQNVLALPHDFLLKDRKTNTAKVTLVSGESREVKFGTENDEAVEILGGLSVGDKVRNVDFLKM